MTRNPTELFFNLAEKQANNNLFTVPSPSTHLEWETGFRHLENNQLDFYAQLEEYILRNEKFIVNYLKIRRQQELNKAQTNFDFVKDL